METVIIYSNCLGTFVLDKNMNIVDKILFSIEDGLKYYKELLEGKEILPEKKLKQKYQTEKPSKDQLEIIFEKISEQISDFSLLREVNLALIKEKLKASVNEDFLIINAINNFEELAKICNALAKRVHEWYGLYFPELSENLSDNEAFVRLVSTKTKEQLIKEFELKETIGAFLSEKDLKPITELAKKTSELYEEKKSLENYLDEIMERYCRNLKSVAGSLIGARLLRELGSLKRLASTTSSTIQMLGAEKALFRHLKNRKNRPPKHGHIINHYLISKAKKQDKGKVARALADKISIAAKVDYFKGEFIGDKLAKELEEKFKLTK